MAPENPYTPTNTAARNHQVSASSWPLALLAFAFLSLGLGTYLFLTQEPVTIYTPYSDWNVSFSEAGPSIRVALLRDIVMNVSILIGGFALLTSLVAIVLRSSKRLRGQTRGDAHHLP